MRILLTRPEQQGEHTAALLRGRGHQVLHAPLLRIETIANVEIGVGPWSAVVMTSANAAHAIATHRRRDALAKIPAFVVGERTREAARAAGFTQVESADGNVEALAQFAARKIARGGSVLYLAGEERAGDLAGALSGAGHNVSTVVVYRAVAETALPDAVARAVKSGSIDAVLHFSTRSAETFLALAADASCLVNVLKYIHFCLSAQVAEPLVTAGAAQVQVAARPDESTLLDLVRTV
jgi:uroporphyrinogen-III synthase